MAVIGSEQWLAAVRDAINASDVFRERAAGWDSPVGLAFRDADGADRHVLLHLVDGACEQAEVVDAESFEAAEIRIAGPVDRWYRVLTGRMDPLRCLVLHRLELVGDPLRVVKFLPAAKALLAAAVTVDVQAPARA